MWTRDSRLAMIVGLGGTPWAHAALIATAGIVAVQQHNGRGVRYAKRSATATTFQADPDTSRMTEFSHAPSIDRLNA